MVVTTRNLPSGFPVPTTVPAKMHSPLKSGVDKAPSTIVPVPKKINDSGPGKYHPVDNSTKVETPPSLPVINVIGGEQNVNHSSPIKPKASPPLFVCLFVCWVICFQYQKIQQFSEVASVACCLFAQYSKEGLLPSVASSSTARDPVHKRKGWGF